MALSSLQERKLTYLFETFDRNGNGVLEQDDQQMIVARICDLHGWVEGSAEYEGYTQQFLKSWYVFEADADGDGQVTLAEWLTFFDDLFSGPIERYYDVVEQTVADIFDLVDLDRNGHLDYEEYKLFLKVHGIDENYAEKCFRIIDIYGNNIITKHELLQLVREYMFSSDTNAPGNYLFGPTN